VVASSVRDGSPTITVKRNRWYVTSRLEGKRRTNGYLVIPRASFRDKDMSRDIVIA
jgi:hypothetical protein